MVDFCLSKFTQLLKQKKNAILAEFKIETEISSDVNFSLSVRFYAELMWEKRKKNHAPRTKFRLVENRSKPVNCNKTWNANSCGSA